MYKYLILFVFGIIFTYLSIVIGKKTKIIDNPSSEKIHKIAIPRTGGIGIFLTFILGIILISNPLTKYEMLFLVLIFSLGFIDDILSIPQKIKFILEIILILFLFITEYWKSTGLYLLDLLFFVFYLVGSINAMNLIDGMDGLAGGIALISTIFLSIWFKGISLVIIISCLAFLVWNSHPAKVFMGDGGSLFLGAFIGLISLKILNVQPTLSTLIALIFIYSIPIYDSAMTIMRRLFLKKKLFAPDIDHFYNKLYEINNNYLRTIFIIYFFAIILGMIGLYLYSLHILLSILIGGSIWFILFYVGYRYGFLETKSYKAAEK
jgi:UDP-GlcNAc:undecaprenyl-phosphate GlcNAc-1-phosphate transferase